MKKLLAATLLVFSSAIFAAEAQLPVQCASTQTVLTQLKDKKVVFVGTKNSPKETTFLIFMDEDGSWVYIGVVEDVACLISGGDKFRINTDLSSKKFL